MRNIRINILISSVVLFGMCAFGIAGRCSHTEYIPHDKDFVSSGIADSFYIGLINGSLMNGAVHTIKENIDEQKYIFKIKALSEPLFSTDGYGYEAEITKVYRGEDEKAGDRIFITRSGFVPYFDGEETFDNGKLKYNSVNCGLKNFMKPGKEYLIFLPDKTDCLIKDNVYCMEGFIIATFFDCDETSSRPVGSDFEDQLSTLYSNVRDYEIFASDEEAVDVFYGFKNEMLEKYP